MKLSYVFLSSITVGLVGTHAMACFLPTPPVAPPPRVWAQLHEPGDLWIWVRIEDVFATTEEHSCSCGVGLGDTAVPIPPLVLVDNVSVGVLNTMTEQIVRTITQFDKLAPDAPATEGWSNGPDVPDERIGAPGPGSRWSGFGADVPALDPGTLQANEVWVVCFNLVWDPGQFTLPAGFSLQVGAGLGMGPGDFRPLFDPNNPHSARYNQVPSPGAGALLFAAAPLMARRRRR